MLVGSNAVRGSRSDEFPFGRPPEELLPGLTESEKHNRIRSRRDGILGGFARPSSPETPDWLLRCSLEMPSCAALGCEHALLETDLCHLLPDVRMPVLQIVGTADPVHSAKGARRLSEHLADSRLVELVGCGHYPMLEAPEESDLALSGFAAV